jgi:hypothetical protein
MIARVLMCYGAAWSVLLLLASASAPPSGQGGRTAYAWVSGDAAVQAAAEAQLRNRTWDFIDGVRGFCGIGWHRAAPGAPWTVSVTSPKALSGCRGVRQALADSGRAFEVVLGGRVPAEDAGLDVDAAVASAVALARQHNLSGYNIDDESECAPRSTLKNFTDWTTFHSAFARGLAAHGLALSSDIYAAFGVENAPYVPQRPCNGLHRPDCPGCMDQFNPDPRIARALAGDSDAATRWVTMDTYFYTLDHFLDALNWHRSFLPTGRFGVGLINSRMRGTPPDSLPLHNVSAQGWAARAYALHAQNISHVSIWSMPLSDEFIWWIPRWKDSCAACATLSCFQPSADC